MATCLMLEVWIFKEDRSRERLVIAALEQPYYYVVFSSGRFIYFVVSIVGDNDVPLLVGPVPGDGDQVA